VIPLLGQATAVGRFEIRDFLGRGAIGDVLLAWDPRHERLVALKVVRSARSDPEILEAEKNGVALQAQLAALAPQVAAVYESGQDGDFFWVAMEYVDGTDLSELLAKGRFAEERAVAIALELVSMLEVCHGYSAEVGGRRIFGIVHGDIKPENIRLQAGDRVRVLDFGIAKHLTQTRRFTVNLFGSLPYTPPERLERGVVDRHSDLWAVGVVLAAMVSGRRPFPGDTPEALEQAIRRGVPCLPLPADCSAALDHVVQRSLAFEVIRRYPSAAELKGDLEALRDGRPLPSMAAGEGGPASDLHATRRTSRPLDPEELRAAEATRRTDRLHAGPLSDAPAAGLTPGTAATPGTPATPVPAAVEDTRRTSNGAAQTPEAVPAGASAVSGAAVLGGAAAGAAVLGAAAAAGATVPGSHAAAAMPGGPAAGAAALSGAPAASGATSGVPTALGDHTPSFPTAPATPSALPPMPLPPRAGATLSSAAPSSAPAAAAPSALAAGPQAVPAQPAAPGRRPRRALRRAVAIVALAVPVMFGATQLWAWNQAKQLRRGMADPHPNLEALAERYTAVEPWCWVSGDLFGVGGDLLRSLTAAAGRILETYHGDDPTATQRGWQTAYHYLHAAAEIAPRDRAIQARMIYVQGHLDRIQSLVLRSQGGDHAKAMQLSREAAAEFQEASRWDPAWPDPYLGLARIYAYDLFDLDALQKTLNELNRRGYRAGRRETAMLADGYRMRGLDLEARAARVAGSEGEVDLLRQAHEDLDQAIRLYTDITGYADSATNREEAREHLEAVEARQTQVHPPGFWERVGRALAKEFAKPGGGG
jgi:hypothetical protein